MDLWCGPAKLFLCPHHKRSLSGSLLGLTLCSTAQLPCRHFSCRVLDLLTWEPTHGLGKKPTVNKTKTWSFQCSQLNRKEMQCNTWMPNKMGWNTNYGKTLQKRLSAPARVQASKLVSRGTKVSCQIWIISLHVDKSSHFYISPCLSPPPSLQFCKQEKKH